MKSWATLGWTTLGTLAVIVLAALWAAPLLWATSAVPPQDWTPAILASALAALLATLVTLALSLTAAYAFSQLRLRARALVFALAVSAFLLPFGALLMPQFRMTGQLGLVDIVAGIVLPQLMAPLAIIGFKRCFDAFPPQLREAAAMDGAGPLRILWSVYLPASGKFAWAMAIGIFIGAWNMLLWPGIIVATPTHDAFGLRCAQAMAAALVVALPVALGLPGAAGLKR